MIWSFSFPFKQNNALGSLALVLDQWFGTFLMLQPSHVVVTPQHKISFS